MTNKRPVDSSSNASFGDNGTDSLQSEVYTRKATPDEVSYRDGYVEGQANERVQAAREQYIRDQDAARERIRESDSVASGVVIGLSLAAILGLVAAAFYFLNRSESPTPPAPAPVAVPASPAASPQSQPRTTIIERTIERTREASPQVPNVQIIQPQPAAPSAAPSSQTPVEPVPSSSQPEAAGTSENSPAAPEPSQSGADNSAGSTTAN